MTDIGNIETATQLILAEALCNAQGDSRFTVEEFLDEAAQSLDSGNMRPEAVDTLQMAVKKATQFCDRNFDDAISSDSLRDKLDRSCAIAELACVMVGMLRRYVSESCYAQILARSVVEAQDLAASDDVHEVVKELAQYADEILNYYKQPKRDNVVQFPKNKQFPKRK